MITQPRACWQRLPPDPVPLEYSIQGLTCTVAGRLDTVVVGWAGAAQDRLRADLPDTRPDRRAVPRRPGDSGRSAGALASERGAAPAGRPCEYLVEPPYGIEP